ALSGVGCVYVLNATSFLFVSAAPLLMRDVRERGSKDRSEVSWRSAVEGLRFVFAQPLIRSTMLLDFFATFFSSATALLPIFAQDVLHVGATGYGWLYAAPSAGAIVAGVVLGRGPGRLPTRRRALLAAALVFRA